VSGLVKQFNSTYPGGGNVSVDWINGEVLKTKTAVAMAGHNPPTVFYTFGGALLEQYIQAGDVANVSSALAADPAWKSVYAANNVFQPVTYKGSIYGIPANGPDFEIMWQNKATVQKAGGTPSPATWSAFMSDVSKLKKAGVSPIAISGKDLWPEMIWMQYLTLRFGGPTVFDKVNALQPGAWSQPAIMKAAQTVQSLAKVGAFEPAFDSVVFESGDADRLLANGQAAFEAQLYYDAANMRVWDPAFAASPNYSPFVFPSVPGGTGNPGDLVGLPAEYFALSAYASPNARKEALAWLKYETTSQTYNVKFLEDRGYTPMTSAAAKYLTTGKVPDGALVLKLYNIGTKAHYLQPYWDQDLPSSVITPMLTDIGELFDLTITPTQFASSLNAALAQARKG